VKICIIGKFPPIQGGVSARTYWTAHDLAARGHEVHVITNSKEARPPFRMHMRRQDWKRCEGVYQPQGRSSASGCVRVHWTDPVDNSQFYIPMASAFVSKLAATAARVHSEHPFDVIYSHYLEPYGVAGHLVADIARVPHVVRMAGSDAGRLWRHPQLEALYDHVLRSAAIVITTGVVAGRAIKRGVRPEHIAPVGAFKLPEDLFRPDGAALDLAALRREVEMDPDMRDMMWGGFTGDRPYFGVYGKLGETKGSFALLAAIERLKREGLSVGLVAMAHGWPALENKFRARAEELDVVDWILQVPFLPHWRVPEFLRSCLAVCCLEQDFPILFHAPVVAREVLTCGSCLVGSTEVIRKLPGHERLPDGYGCVAIEDVQDVAALSARLAAIVRDPKPIASVAARGRAFARALQPDAATCSRLEQLLRTAVRRRAPRRHAPAIAVDHPVEDPRFPITQLAAETLEPPRHPADASPAAQNQPFDLFRARAVLSATEIALADGDAGKRSVAAAIRLEIAIAEAEEREVGRRAQARDPLFRLRSHRWALAEGDLSALVPVRDPQLRLLTVDVTTLVEDAIVPNRPAMQVPRSRRVAAFAAADGERRDPLFVSEGTARILELSDGTRTAQEIAVQIAPETRRAGLRRALRDIEELFVAGLLSLSEGRVDGAETGWVDRRKSA
jgi:glycosyltransferase involved in cell wall biosynthesis